MNMTRKTPVAGIGFGQRGYWGNRHFSTMEAAQAAYEQYCRELRNEAAPSGTGGRMCWTHGAIETPLALAGNLIQGAKFRGKLKSGKPGKTVHTVHLYAIDAALAARFLADPFYSCE